MLLSFSASHMNAYRRFFRCIRSHPNVNFNVFRNGICRQFRHQIFSHFTEWYSNSKNYITIFLIVMVGIKSRSAKSCAISLKTHNKQNKCFYECNFWRFADTDDKGTYLQLLWCQSLRLWATKELNWLYKIMDLVWTFIE